MIVTGILEKEEVVTHGLNLKAYRSGMRRSRRSTVCERGSKGICSSSMSIISVGREDLREEPEGLLPSAFTRLRNCSYRDMFVRKKHRYTDEGCNFTCENTCGKKNKPEWRFNSFRGVRKLCWRTGDYFENISSIQRKREKIKEWYTSQRKHIFRGKSTAEKWEPQMGLFIQVEQQLEEFKELAKTRWREKN